LAIGVSLLPRFAGHATEDGLSQVQFADLPPSLVETPAPPGANSGQQLMPAGLQSLRTADPAYVQQRLDEAGQQLLSGVASYFSRTASELLQPERPTAPAGSFSPPANAYRY
jgi:hypothetical protein